MTTLNDDGTVNVWIDCELRRRPAVRREAWSGPYAAAGVVRPSCDHWEPETYSGELLIATINGKFTIIRR